ncbi:MAG TPA: MarP family serine protease [Candidatus Limnocylindrales bacterium]
MNPFDVIAIALIVLAVVLGFRSGAMPQVGGLIGAIGGGALAILALPYLADPLQSLDPAIRPFIVLAGLLLAVGIGESVGSAIGRLIARGLGTGVLGAADRVGGAFVGVAQALLVVWLAGGLLAIGPVPRLTEAAQTSTAVRTLNAVLPAPDQIAAELGTLLDSSGLPDVFVGFEPMPRPPVDRPADSTARRIAAAAEGSTLRVVASTCGLSSSGTGVAIDDDYVVTNAHVVAGANRRGVRVATATGRLTDATVVMFDPDLDVALLHAPGLDVPALRFAARDPERGAIGATLGYPGGGALTIVPAAVTGAYPAIGRDIYGASTVRRDILELRADVDRGDSGGPFMLEDSTVGGLVFAEARTNDEVGYALTPTAVATRVAPSVGRSGSVATGDCLED